MEEVIQVYKEICARVSLETSAQVSVTSGRVYKEDIEPYQTKAGEDDEYHVGYYPSGFNRSFFLRSAQI